MQHFLGSKQSTLKVGKNVMSNNQALFNLLSTQVTSWRTSEKNNHGREGKEWSAPVKELVLFVSKHKETTCKNTPLQIFQYGNTTKTDHFALSGILTGMWCAILFYKLHMVKSLKQLLFSWHFASKSNKTSTTSSALQLNQCSCCCG